MNLKGKTAVITGAGSGIGQDIALRFAQAGAAIGICDINMDGAEKTKSMVEKAGSKGLTVKMDVTQEDEVIGGVDKIAAAFGSVDILISNAGIQIVHPIEDFPLAEFRKLVSIHLDGAFLTTKACVKHMYAQGSGSLLYMGSAHSHVASPLKCAYVAAKHGILGLARVMAKEGAKHGVRSNVICPGFVKTPLVEKQIPEQARDLGISEEEVVSRIMLGDTVDQQFTTMDDVAEVALFLAAFPTNALTGQSIMISHGWMMN